MANYLQLSISLFLLAPAVVLGEEASCKRIVSLLPSATDCLFALEAGDLVVGVTRFDSHHLPVVGGIVDASRERILALSPDCIVGPRVLLQRLALPRVQTIGVEFSTLEELWASIQRLGEITKRRERAERLITRLKRELNKLHASTGTLPQPRVLILVSLHPLYAAGPEGFLGQLLALVGGIDVVRQGRFVQIPYELVIALQPEIVIVLSERCSIPSSLLSWKVPASVQGRVFTVCDPELLRPGPGIVQAAMTLYTLIHGPYAPAR